MSVPTCRPKRSLRTQRGFFAIGLSLATVTWLIAILAPSKDKGVDPMVGLDPGQLSANHSFLVGQCSRCHSDQQMASIAITDIHDVAATHQAIEDGKLCLACHKSIGGTDNAFAFSPHTAEMLKQDSKGSGSSAGLLLSVASKLAGDHLGKNGIQCSTCHQEHHGEEFNIATLSNQQCQICHQDQFESFSKGHPEFSKSRYPYNRRTAIRFDHYSHYQTHFKEELETHPDTVPAGYNPAATHLESASCAACHIIGKSGEPMTVKPFESSCAACHDNNTKKGGSIPFLALPPLNIQSLDEHLGKMDPPRSLGKWVDPASDIPWPTLQLLPGEARAAWNRLREKNLNPFNQEDALPDDPKVIADVETVAWAIKGLVRDLAQTNPGENPSNLTGHDELVRRLTESGFPNPEPLIKGFPAGGFDLMRQRYNKRDDELKGKSLLEEVEAMRAGVKPPPLPSAEPNAPESKADSPDSTATENFGEAGTGETFDGEATPKSVETFGEGGTGEAFGEESAPKADEKPVETFGETGTGESFGEEMPPKADVKPVETFGETGTGESFGGGEEFGAEPKKESVDKVTPPKELDSMDAATWASRGGWYQEYGAIYYRSTGHADPLIKSWLDALASRVSDPLSLAQLKEGFDFRAGAESQTSGSCLMCHAVDEIRDHDQHLMGAKINWKSLAAGPARGSLTRYDHATHLLLTDCRTCHQTQTGQDAGTGFQASFPMSGDWDVGTGWSSNADPSKFISNFKTIPKSTCAECHQAQKAGDACIQCHLYHKAASQSTSPPAIPDVSRR